MCQETLAADQREPYPCPSVASSQTWLRVRLGYHTWPQVLVGYGLGTCMALGWWRLGVEHMVPLIKSHAFVRPFAYGLTGVGSCIYVITNVRQWIKEHFGDPAVRNKAA
jgi:hypothetical protein